MTARRGVMVVSPCRGDVCARQLVMTTRDGGRRWRVSGRTHRLAATSFVSLRVGYGIRAACLRGRCRADLWRTRNGGRTWWFVSRVVHRPKRESTFSGATTVRFVDAARGWVALDGALERTLDGGATWERLPLRCPRRYPSLDSLSFTDPAHGVALCSWGQPATDMQGKEILQTGDGGWAWRVIATSARGGALPIDGDLGSLDQPTSTRGYLTGARGGLSMTTDDWRSSHELLFTDDEAIMTGTSWPTRRVGYVVAGPVLLRTSDGGCTWRQIYPRPVIAPAATMTFVPPAPGRPGYGVAGQSTAYGFLGGRRAILRTDAAGRWAQIAALPGGEVATVTRSGPSLYALTSGIPGRTRLFRSVNDGAGLSLVAIVPRSSWLAVTAHAFYVVSDDGDLLRSTDARRWRVVYPHPLWDVEFTSDDAGVGVDDSGRVVHTVDGGRTWRPLPNLPSFPDVQAVDALGTHVWVAAGRRIVWTPDLGGRWQTIRFSRPIETQAGALDFVTPSIGYLQSGGRTLRTTDSGRSWRPLARPR
jgi:photosystem II stability/assembly factor-like uncharacterized protein